jgi:hypothetical protein
MAKVLILNQTIKEAEEAEEEQNVSIAKEDLKEVIRNNSLAEKAYDRLMILYRREKDYKSELKLINAGIKAFEAFYKSKKSRSKKIAEVSDKLNRAFGFTDKKGNNIYDPEPVARWKKRKATVLKRLK